MTNTIHNVPRELLERAVIIIERIYPKSVAMNDIKSLLSAPSPAGVDGLEVKRYWHNPKLGFCELDPKYFDDDPGYVTFGDAQAIIDGLRGEVERLDRESQNLSNQLGACGRDRNLFRAERDQQAQRIGELEGLLDRVKVSLSLDDTEWGYSAPEKYKLLADIRAALSAGKEGE